MAIHRREGKNDVAKVTKLWGFQGLERVEVDTARAGDIIAVTGIDGILPGETLTDVNDPQPLPHARDR